MSYTTCRDALKTLLTGVAETITVNDYSPLDGGAASLIVLSAGNCAGIDLLSMQPACEWVVRVTVLSHTITTDPADITAFEVLRDAVLALVASAPDMGGLIHVENYAAVDDEPQGYYDKAGGGPFYIGQRIDVTIQEEV